MLAPAMRKLRVRIARLDLQASPGSAEPGLRTGLSWASLTTVKTGRRSPARNDS
jgi:hypothetical protein